MQKRLGAPSAAARRERVDLRAAEAPLPTDPNRRLQRHGATDLGRGVHHSSAGRAARGLLRGRIAATSPTSSSAARASSAAASAASRRSGRTSCGSRAWLIGWELLSRKGLATRPRSGSAAAGRTPGSRPASSTSRVRPAAPRLRGDSGRLLSPPDGAVLDARLVAVYFGIRQPRRHSWAGGRSSTRARARALADRRAPVQTGAASPTVAGARHMSGAIVQRMSGHFPAVGDCVTSRLRGQVPARELGHATESRVVLNTRRVARTARRVRRQGAFFILTWNAGAPRTWSRRSPPRGTRSRRTATRTAWCYERGTRPLPAATSELARRSSNGSRRAGTRATARRSFSVTSQSMWALRRDARVRASSTTLRHLPGAGFAATAIPERLRVPFRHPLARRARSCVEFPMTHGAASQAATAARRRRSSAAPAVRYMRWGMRRVNHEGQPAIVYLHRGRSIRSSRGSKSRQARLLDALHQSARRWRTSSAGC